MSREEEKRKNISLVISVSSHVLLLLILFLAVAWREPNPPIPEYGIELSFGVQTKGLSTTDKQVSATPPNTVDQSQEIEQDVQEEVIENTQEEVVDASAEEIPVETDSEVKVEPITEAQKEVAEVHEETLPNEQIESRQKSSESKSTADNNEEEDKNSPEKNNQEEDSNGNDGVEKIDDRALYGKKEGTSNQGSFLNISGWMWDNKPRPNDTSSENGKIVFQITIDDNGDIIGIKTLESTVTPAVERIYKDEVTRLSFSPTSDNFAPAPTSKGEITFIIKSR